MFEVSHCYYCFYEELYDDRLDVLYNDTIFNIIEEKIAKTRFSFIPVSEVATPINDSCNPQESPDEEFLYVDIGSIDRVRGIPFPEIIIGHQATSSRMRRVMHKDNILVSTTRPTRKAICVVPEELDDCICSTGFAVLKCKPNILSKFLFYALRSDLTTWQFERLCSGSGYPAINPETDLAQIRIPELDLETQRGIIKALEPIEAEASRLDIEATKIREAADKILPTVLGIDTPASAAINYFFKTGGEKQTIWFSVFPNELTDRLHYLFFHPRYQMLDMLCSRYRTASLTEISSEPILRGEQPAYDDFGIVTVLKTVDLKNDYIDYENALKVSETFFEAHPTAQVQRGDILIASTGYVSMGKVDVYDSDESAMVDGHISIVRVNDHYDPYFIAYFLRSHLGQLQFEKFFTGASGQIEVQPADLGGFIVPVSAVEGIPLVEQQSIAAAITNKLNQARMLEQQAATKWQEVNTMFEEWILID